MEFRYLGNSGLKISEITYGNWLTHGSQVENEVATQCVRAALDASGYPGVAGDRQAQSSEKRRGSGRCGPASSARRPRRPLGPVSARSARMTR